MTRARRVDISKFRQFVDGVIHIAHAQACALDFWLTDHACAFMNALAVRYESLMSLRLLSVQNNASISLCNVNVLQSGPRYQHYQLINMFVYTSTIIFFSSIL